MTTKRVQCSEVPRHIVGLCNHIQEYRDAYRVLITRSPEGENRRIRFLLVLIMLEESGKLYDVLDGVKEASLKKLNYIEIQDYKSHPRKGKKGADRMVKDIERTLRKVWSAKTKIEQEGKSEKVQREVSGIIKWLEGIKDICLKTGDGFEEFRERAIYYDFDRHTEWDIDFSYQDLNQLVGMMFIEVVTIRIAYSSKLHT